MSIVLKFDGSKLFRAASDVCPVETPLILEEIFCSTSFLKICENY